MAGRPRRSAPAPTYRVTRQTYRAKQRQLRHEETRDLLPPVTLGLAVATGTHAIVEVLVVPADQRWALAGFSAILGILLLVLRFGMATPRLPPRYAPWVALLVGIIAVSPPLLHIVITADTGQAPLLALLLVGAGYVLVSIPTLLLLIALTYGGYAYAWATEGDTGWAGPALFLLLAGFLALLLGMAHTHAVRRTLDLRIRDEHGMTSMARATRAVSESELRFRRLAEAAFEGLIIHDQGRILDVNEAAATLLGTTREHLMGRHLNEIVPQNGSGPGDGLLEAPSDRLVEYRLRRMDDSEVLVEARGREIPFRGVPARVIALRDITLTRRLQHERIALAERLERILDAAAEGVYGLDPEGHVVFINRAALDALGYRSEEVVGAAAHPLFHHRRPDGADYAPDDCPILRTAIDQEARRVDNEVFWARDGTAIPIEYATSPIRQAGVVTGTVVVFRDITERREVERMKDELVSVVSHELKTPLTSIHGSLRLLTGGRLGDLPPQADRMLQIAERNTDRLMRLVNDILDVERLRAGKTTIKKRLIPAVPLIQEAVETMRAAADERDVTIRTDVAEVTLFCDRDRAIQAITNLVSNAIKFSPDGGTIDVRAQRDSRQALIEVHDEGPGVPEDKRHLLFQRFSQADASDRRATGGTGLGLSITKAIVEHHGGEIGYEPSPGGGSRFWFTLPLADPQEAGV